MMDIGAIVMAAGLGTRMKSDLPKVLHPLCGKPLLGYVLDLLLQAKVKKIALVVSHHKEQVEAFVSEHYPKCVKGKNPLIVLVDQKKPQGTGHAILVTEKVFKGFIHPIAIVSGDVPGLSLKTFEALIHSHEEAQAELTFASAILDASYPYGRVLRNERNQVTGMVEALDATEGQLKIQEMGVGLYCVDPKVLFLALKKLTPNNAKKEYYLTDIVKWISKKEAYIVPNKEEVLGINNRYELAQYEKIFRYAINKRWMLEGVTIIDPETTYIDAHVKLAHDVVLEPNTHLYGKTSVGEGTMIGSGAILQNSIIGAHVHIKSYTIIEESKVDDQATIGPFARLRPESHVKKKARVGNFVELKKTVLGEDSKANHLAYLGDAVIGKDVNVGCGVITCNYDGGLQYSGKAKTKIEDHVFVGSDCQLIAPVTLKKGAYVASGTTVTQNVPKDSLVIARAPQVTKAGYMKKLWARAKKRK